MSEGRSGDGPSKGSVRRAREMAEGTQPSKVQTSNRQPPPLPAAFKSLDQGPKGAVISKPTPMPQWPLPEGPRRENAPSPVDMTSSNKGPAPQRPPRPGNVPSLLDASKVREYTPTAAAQKPAPASKPQADSPPNTRPEANDVLSPASTQESLTSANSGRPSTTSSVGTIPDFPLPAVQTAPPPQPASSGRKTSNLGPPRTTRRGASSFYSASSYVSPIPEEFTESAPKSFASSKVMPSSWGSADILDAYQDSRDSDSSDSSPSIHDDGEVTLVRQASLGKRAKPALRTINKSQGDNRLSDSETKPAVPRDKGVDTSRPGPTAAGTAVSASEYSKATGLQKEVDIPRQHKHQRSYSSSSDSSAEGDLEKPPIPMASHATLEATMKELELEDLDRASNRTNQRKLDMKRPPRLDIEAVREAEERGSLTSLPDLIRRATRLASNLDNGRTASRLGILDMFNANGGDMKRTGPRNSGSISDILASFPPPGAAGRHGDSRPGQNDHRANPDAVLPADHPDASPKAGRRCCGMRRWVFILLCIAIVIIIAAAVVIPIMLLVVPQNEEAATQPTNTPLATDSCEAIQPCQNGGVSIGSLDSCRCVCVDGFRGSGCAIAGDGSCATLDISDESTDYRNATLGSALPRLFEEAATNFSIPLNASKILSLFNAEDASCTSENAIVTFNGDNRRRDVVHTGGPSRRHGQKRRSLAARQKGYEAIQDPKPTKTGKPTKTASPSSTPTSTSSPSSPITDRVLDFGRIAVLFILERTEEFQEATTAHDSIQRFFRNVSDGSPPQGQDQDEDEDEDDGLNQSMGVECDSQEFSLDFINFTIELGDGTVVGGESEQGPG